MKNMITLVESLFDGLGIDTDVPFNESVDTSKLLSAAIDPLFVTLPIAKDFGVSANGLVYTPEFNMELVNQLKEGGVLANFGHESMFGDPLKPDGVWVGAMKEDSTGLVWAKALVITEESKTLLRVLLASGSQIATSVVVGYESTIELGGDRFAIDHTTMQLFSLDFVPAKMPALDFDERSDMKLSRQSKENSMAKKKITEKVLEIIADPIEEGDDNDEDDLEEAELAPVLESVTTVGSTSGSISNEAKVMQEQINSLREERTNLALKNLIGESVKINDADLRNYVKMCAVQGGLSTFASDEEVEKSVTAVLESAAYQKFAKALAEHLSGGSVVLDKSSGIKGDREKTIDSVMENLDDIRKKYGIGKN